jgi:KDO2-lipid IV(A) lauroyltransferase
MKIIKYLFQSIIIYFFFIIGKIIGIKLSRSLFGYLFKKFGPLFKSKKVIKKNLENLKNLTEEEKKNIIFKMWESYGIVFIEYIFLNKFRREKDLINIEGKEILDDIIKSNKPAIFVSGHFSNFELMSLSMTKSGLKLATIYRPLNNFFLNPFMEYLRRKFVCQNQIKKGVNGVREAIDFVKRNYSIALMVDQRVSEGEKINFFGKPALTTTLPAQIAIKYDLPIIPVFIKRDKDNSFTIRFFKKIVHTDFKDKLELTLRLNQIIEQLIVENPHEWIWTHNRWKS